MLKVEDVTPRPEAAEADDMWSHLLTSCRTPEELVGAVITVVVVAPPPPEEEPAA